MDQLLAFIARARARPLLLRLGFAVALTVLALAVRRLVLDELDTVIPFLTFYPAIVLSTALGGLYAGVAAAGLSAMLAVFFIVGFLERAGMIGIAEFLASAALIVSVVELAVRSERERALSKNQEEKNAPLRRLIEQAPVAMAMFDRDMIYLAASDRWFEVFGVKPASTIGRCHYDVFPRLPERWKDAHRRGLLGQSVSGEWETFDDHTGASTVFSWQVQPWRTEGDETAGIIIIVEDLTARATAERELRMSEQRLSFALSAGQLAIWDWGLASSDIVWNDEHYRILGYQPRSIQPSYDAWARRVVKDDLGEVELRLQKAAATGGNYTAQYRVYGADDRIRWVEAFGQVMLTGDTASARMYGILRDITDQKMAEAQTRLLLQEINHRAKNLLAVVQSIAELTAEETEPQSFAAVFKSRLASLSACHDLLVRSGWRGVDLETLIRSEVAHLEGGAQERRMEISGSTLQLNALAAQTIGMAVHELATNAVKFGALSYSAGRISVQWQVDTETERFRLEWKETGGPPVVAPDRQGFGTSVMKDNVIHALDADVSLLFPASGLIYNISAPLASVAEPE